jgi:hypothetical protein
MFGRVSDHHGNPIFMIKVSVYRDDRLLAKGYTGEDGRYNVDIKSDAPVSIHFDTHPTLIGAEKWHPSILSNIVAKTDLQVDRILSATWSEPDNPSKMDALSAYQFAVMWLDLAPEGYAVAAAKRLGSMKFSSIILQEIQQKLIQYLDSQK